MNSNFVDSSITLFFYFLESDFIEEPTFNSSEPFRLSWLRFRLTNPGFFAGQPDDGPGRIFAEEKSISQNEGGAQRHPRHHEVHQTG